MDHKYSTVLVCVLFFLSLVIIVTGLSSEEIDEVCEDENSLLIKKNGVWDCSKTHYAEAYFHSYESPVEMTLGSTGLYYNITNFTMNGYYGLVPSKNGINVMKQANYKISLLLTFQGGNNGDYEIELFINDVSEPKCATFQTTSAGAHNNAVINCIMNLSVNDHLDVRIKDMYNPAQDISYHQLNFNMVEIV